MGWWKTIGQHRPRRIFILDRVPAPRFVVRFKDPGHLPDLLNEVWECTKCESTKTWDFSAPEFTIFNPRWVPSKRPCNLCLWDSTYERAGRFGEADVFGGLLRDASMKPTERVQVHIGLRPGWQAPDKSSTFQLGNPISPRDEPDCAHCANGVEHEKCTSGWRMLLGLNMLKNGLPPKWVPPCDTCGGNCGQCGESHCAICGVKPKDGPCDQAKHESHSFWKLGAGHEP